MASSFSAPQKNNIMPGETMTVNQKQLASRNLLTASFRSQFSALFDRLNPLIPLSKYHDGNDRQGDCENVFEQGSGQIASEQFRDKGSCFGTCKSSDNTADDS